MIRNNLVILYISGIIKIVYKESKLTSGGKSFITTFGTVIIVIETFGLYSGHIGTFGLYTALLDFWIIVWE